MSAKIFFDSKSEIPEHLQSEAREVDGKYELGATGVLNKNKELLGKNAALTAKVDELAADKIAIEANRDEWKGKASIPAGQKLVTEAIAELGEAAQVSGLAKDELPTLKTAKEDLQKQIDVFAAKEVVAEVMTDKGFNNRFKTAAIDKGLKFEKQTETVDGKEINKWLVIGADNAKTDIDTFLKTDGYFKEFADTFGTDEQAPGQTGISIAQQRSSKAGKPTQNPAEDYIQKHYATQKQT